MRAEPHVVVGGEQQMGHAGLKRDGALGQFEFLGRGDVCNVEAGAIGAGQLCGER